MRFEQTKEYKDIDILPEQEKYISSMDKINKALQKEKNYGFNIYIEEYKIGFILLRQFSHDSFFLWDYIIDRKFQNKGYGTYALIKLLDFLRKEFCAKVVTTTYIWGNEHAKYIYEKIGFIETDVVDEDGIHEVNLKITF